MTPMLGAVVATLGRRMDVRHARGARLPFPVLALCILGFYALLRAPVLDSESYLDPWIYTAAFKNFGAMYRLFGDTYYVSRLPWIIPGIGVHSIFPPLAAFFVLHILFFVVTGGFAYLLFRDFYGQQIAIAGAAALMLSPLFYDSYSNDYPDGAVLTYLFGAAYFGLTAAPATTVRRTPRLVVAGFFAAAAVGTNLFSVVVVGGLVLSYLVITSGSTGWLSRLTSDVVAALAGSFALLGVCGIFSRAYGGPFLFFLPQWRFARSVNTSHWKLHGYEWLRHESQLLVPLIVLVFLAVALLVRRKDVVRRRSEPRVRATLGAAVLLVYLVSLIAIWEFAFTGDFLELTYYFTLFNVPVALAIAGTLDVFGFAERSRVLLAGAAAVVAGLPLLLVYGVRVSPTSAEGARVTLLVFGGAAVALCIAYVLARRRPRFAPSIALVAALSLLFVSNFAAASGGSTASVFQNGRATFVRRHAALTMALQLIEFVRSHRLQQTAPNFWYDDQADPFLDGIQSTYLWGTTYIGRSMPAVDTDLRTALRNRRPETLILLSSSTRRAAEGAEAILRLHYHLKLLATGYLHAGSYRFGIHAYRIVEYYRGDAFARYYGSVKANVEPLPNQGMLARWTFARGVPEDWSTPSSLRARRNVNGTSTFDTSTRQWEYELMAPKKTLEPGRYGVFLRGRILHGGIDVGILDAKADRWLTQSTYWFRQRLGSGWMVANVQLERPTEIQVILSNWVPPGIASSWELEQLRLVRLHK